ncbi:MAG: hypothetical protein HUU37_00315 [Bdellovibrionales bacterium]|nr:hypothetical protein [Bdellovibrionales bacterium]
MFEKKNTHSPWLDIAVFAVMVGFFLFSASRLTGKNRAAEELVPPAPAAQERTPAAAPPSHGPDGVSEVQLDCVSDRPRVVETDSTFLKLSGRFCQTSPRPSSGRGRNAASGAEILCFILPQEQRFATNYFQLHPGTNPIELEILFSNGKSRLTRVEVRRR